MGSLVTTRKSISLYSGLKQFIAIDPCKYIPIKFFVRIYSKPWTNYYKAILMYWGVLEGNENLYFYKLWKFFYFLYLIKIIDIKIKIIEKKNIITYIKIIIIIFFNFKFHNIFNFILSKKK